MARCGAGGSEQCDVGGVWSEDYTGCRKILTNFVRFEGLKPGSQIRSLTPYPVRNGYPNNREPLTLFMEIHSLS